MKNNYNLESNRCEKDGKFCYNAIPTRFVFVFLGFFGFNLVYAYKVVLSVTIVAMVGHNSSEHYSDECKDSNTNTNVTSNHTITTGDYNWTEQQSTSVLGAFFYGYVLTQIPGGLLAERFGAKWIFGSSILITAVLALISPLAADLSYGAFFAVRVGQGLAEGVVFPVMNSMLAKWLPKMERSLGSTIVFTGAQIGTVITMPLAGVFSDGHFWGGWRAIFYLLGITGCLWFVLWALLVSESPEAHPHISSKELDFIKKGQGIEAVTQRGRTPWKQIFTSVPMWALIITHIGQNWGFLTILTLLPTYFQKILLMDIKSNGLKSSLPWLLCALLSWVVGMISDRVRSTGKVPINVIRKFCNSVGFLGPAVCMIGVVFSGCHQTVVTSLFILAMGLNGFIFSGLMTTHVDMAPDFAGTLMGITNSIGNIPGFLAPMVANAFTEGNQTLKSWSYVFYLSAGVYTFASIVYVLFASAQLQSWAQTKKSIKTEN